ncbi:MAG: DUF362 domain-containing protein [Methanotrichaceae archaeon]|nr:DUF362 domain-containing protein [Methanotrichaceae archaeon]
MASAVYFADTRARSDKESKVNKIKKLFHIAGFGDSLEKESLTAIKVHFGERGTDAYLNPIYVRQIVESVKSKGSRPFITDTNTLYGGGRSNSADHLVTALDHGFGYSAISAPLIIADGLRGNNFQEIKINQKHFDYVKIAGDIARADNMIVLSHFKGHILSGFGGAIKNLGMGCAPAAGKAEQHSAKPIFKPELCIGCARCMEICPRSAITVEKTISTIDYSACKGCGECLRICPAHTIDFDWLVDIPPFLERMAEYALGAVQGKVGRVGFMNFLLNITPDCDCVPWSDSPFVPDIGILASTDPVALDHASYDLVNLQQGLKNSLLGSNIEPGADKFKGIWEHTNGIYLLEYASKIDLGKRDYRLIKVN